MSEKQSYTGQSIDRYAIRQLIGKGAIGEVYEAFDEKLLRPVAIKITHPKEDDESALLDRMVREAQIMARVEHANIVPIYDVVNNNNSALIVMRLVKGEDMKQMLASMRTGMEVSEAFKIMYQIILGMDYAHSRGVIHSDLKPENIFVTESGEIFILDFGLAALLELERMEQGKIYGTPLYMPPEQFGGAYLDARSDIYSLGIILYMLICGEHPFKAARSLKELLSLQAKQAPQAPHEVNSDIPEEFSLCVTRALEKDPRMRFYSCRDFLHAMEKSLPDMEARELSARELRWDPRADVDLNAFARLNKSDDLTKTKITNLSVTGASLLAPFSCRIGDKISLAFEVNDDGAEIHFEVSANVMWCDRQDESHIYEIGVSFEELDDMDKQYLSLFIRDILLS